ncbi:MAG: hypothetical protein O3A36_03800 [bacterium]|nr:hypothetical protein [bacterium]
MKILVVDDNKKHRESALDQLSTDHEVVTLDSYESAIEVLQRGCNIDVLLSDLLMPAEPYCLGPQGLKLLGHEIPIGLVLMLRAAQVGIPLIAVITDANHHCHPMSAALDWIGPAYWNTNGNKLMKINTSTVLIAHAPLLDDGRKNWQAALCTLQNK